MAENDIYNNKKRYESFIANLDRLKEPLETNSNKDRKRKYYCKNAKNLEYFMKFSKNFETKDNSYIRRLRLLRTLLIIANCTEKDFAQCTREDINEIVAFNHTVNKTVKSKSDFIKDLKYMWKTLFPDKDKEGRIDETIVPYLVRHLSSKIEKSKEKRKNDRLTVEEYEKLVTFFSKDPQMQFYITLSMESLGRPQEICYTRIADVEINKNYAKINVSSHGKEGIKFLQCIDSYPYLLKWYEKHPFRDDPESFLFIASGEKDRQLTPFNIRMKLKLACEKLGIKKQITPYSLKRNGVTFSRLRGDSDAEIQFKAGWTSTKQLQTYDMTTAEDCFKKELAKRGLITDEEYQIYFPKTKDCLCGAKVGFTEKFCPQCKRLLDREQIKKNIEAENIISQILEKIAEKNKDMIINAINELGIKEKIEKL